MAGSEKQTDKKQINKNQTDKNQTSQNQADKKQPSKNQTGKTQKDKDQENTSRKKSHTFRNFVIAVIFLIALLGAGLYMIVGAAYDKMNFKEIETLSDLPLQEDGVINILLIGNDSRQNGEDGRSDAMILLSISSKTKGIYMTSLLRDM